MTKFLNLLMTFFEAQSSYNRKRLLEINYHIYIEGRVLLLHIV